MEVSAKWVPGDWCTARAPGELRPYSKDCPFSVMSQSYSKPKKLVFSAMSGPASGRPPLFVCWVARALARPDCCNRPCTAMHALRCSCNPSMLTWNPQRTWVAGRHRRGQRCVQGRRALLAGAGELLGGDRHGLRDGPFPRQATGVRRGLPSKVESRGAKVRRYYV